jgi:hypothetical protein
MHFGIYPLGVAGTPTGLAAGPPDDHDAIRRCLAELAASGVPVVPRTYVVAGGPGSERSVRSQLDRLADAGLLGHVVLGTMHDAAELDVEWWRELVRAVVTDYGRRLASLQITNEPNLTFMEGARPYVVDAVVHGVLAAKRAAAEQRLALPIGLGSVPQSDVALPGFWRDLRRAGAEEFAGAVDFVGHNFYVDVFEEPVDLAEVPARVHAILTELRGRRLPEAGLPPSVPIRVTENGWPTGSNPLTGAARDEARQAEVLEKVIRTVAEVGEQLNVSHYMLFGLRDADSGKSDPFHRFGIVRDTYAPKPAFARFGELVAELGERPENDGSTTPVV